MAINWENERHAFNTLPVPQARVTQRIQAGLATAKPLRRRHNVRRVLFAVALLLFVCGLTAPAALQAGGLIPAFKQILDRPATPVEKLDPTANQLLGDLADAQRYRPLNTPAQTTAGIKVQPMGTLATAGLIAVLVDYSGPNIDPDQLARNPVAVKLSTGAPVGDVEHAAGKVALGHYRQVLVFYPPVTTTANIPSFALTFQALNGTKHALTFSGLQPERFTTTQHALALTHHVSQNVTTALTQLLVTPNAFLVDYTTTFTPTALTAQQAHAYSQAAWLSDASLRVNGRQIGSLALGLSGTKLAQTRHGDALTARFQSQFTTRYRDSAQHLRALSDAPKGATIQFTVTLPGEPGGSRQAAGTFSVPVALFLN